MLCDVVQSAISVDEVFRDFERTPVASASVAQVHFARLPDGTEVAVGILHAALPASADVRNGVAFVRLAEVAAARLTGLDAAAIADLKTRHLIVR